MSARRRPAGRRLERPARLQRSLKTRRATGPLPTLVNDLAEIR